MFPPHRPACRPLVSAVTFTGVVLGFIAGAVGSALLVMWWDRAAIVVAALILIVALVWLLLGERRRAKDRPADTGVCS